MKLLHFADLHIGYENYGRFDPQTGLSSRLLDFLKVFDEVVDFALKNKVEAVLFAGDAYKTRDPSPTQQREFAKRIMTLAKGGIPVVLLVGNHDTPNVETKANTLDIYSTLEIENVHVLRKPELVNIKLPSLNFQLQVLGLPWLPKSDYKTLGETMRSLYEKIDPKFPAILLAHATVEGAVFSSERNVMLGSDFVIPLSLLTCPKLSYVALGHLHKRQVLAQNPAVVYCGSLERIDFGEEHEEKSFEIVEINQGKTTHQPIKVSARPFKTLTFDFTPKTMSPTDKILKEIQKNNLEEAVVRVVINVPQDVASQIKTEEIKKALEKAHFVAAVQKNIIQTVRGRLDGVNMEELTTLDALTAYFKARQYPENKIKELLKYAQELIEEP